MHRIKLEAALEVVEALGFFTRDIGLLDSGLERPVTRLYGQYVYPDISTATAAQTESLARHHPLADGNKRTALIMLNIFLRINGMKHVMDSETSYSLMMGIAEGRISVDESAQTLLPHLRPW